MTVLARGELAARRAHAVRDAAHATLRESKQYQDELTALARITTDFLDALQYAWAQGDRSASFGEQSLVLCTMEDLIEAAIAVAANVRDGALNPARRELRFIIDGAVKHLYFDQQHPSGTLAERLAALEQNTRHGLEPLQELHLWLAEPIASEFRSAVGALYYDACAYVHPSAEQIRARLERRRRGATIGYESVDDLRRMRQTVFRVYDVALVLVYHGLGEGIAGDVFVQVFDRIPRWRFHKGRYVKALSRVFDDKDERQHPPNPDDPWVRVQADAERSMRERVAKRMQDLEAGDDKDSGSGPG